MTRSQQQGDSMAGSGYSIDADTLKEQGKRFARISSDFGSAGEKFDSKVSECEAGWGSDTEKLIKPILTAYTEVSRDIRLVLPVLQKKLGELGVNLNKIANDYQAAEQEQIATLKRVAPEGHS
ncbi:WXG100 family type VII secretion target [Streptomyces sp. NPDC054786]